MKARLELAASLSGALDRPERLARLCLDARLACGFELRADVWTRPQSNRRIPSATVGQALTAFVGQDYRIAWRDGVLLVSPSNPAPASLDAEVTADVSGNTPTDRGESLTAVSRTLGLGLIVEGKRPNRPDPASGATLPMTAPARRILGMWTSPAQSQPNSWIVVYSRDGRSGRLHWFWGGR